MNIGVAICAAAAALVLSGGALAAPPKQKSVDQSANFLMDNATAAALWKENTPAPVMRLYPPRKFRFVSEVGGGFADNKSCVVAARAMLLPVVTLPVQGAKVVYAPIRTATAFDAVPNLDRAQCQQLAKAKLKEAIQSIVSSLAAN